MIFKKSNSPDSQEPDAPEIIHTIYGLGEYEIDSLINQIRAAEFDANNNDDFEDSEQELHIFKNDGFLIIKDTNMNIIDIFNQSLSYERNSELHRNGKPN